MSFQIWDGLYGSFAATGAPGTVFEGERWLSKARERLEQARQEEPASGEYLLPMAAAMLAGDGPLRILDFGGGVGISFLSVARTLPETVNLDYHVVESAATCAAGRQAHRDEARLHFHEELPDDLGAVHLLHLGSVLQYVEDWRALLRRLAGQAPGHVLISDAFVGEIPPFITVQDYYGEKIPFQFLNHGELTGFMSASLGYRLVFDCGFIPTVQGHRQFYSMENLPPECRITRGRHLLFRRTGGP